MKTEEIKNLFNLFEAAAAEVEGIECWSARELQKLLGYSKWENFEKVVGKAKDACSNAGEETDYHFPDVRKTIPMPKGAEKEIDDILLTRYACYLIAQNGDSRKEEIAFVQNYFAIQRLNTQQLKRKMGVPDNRPVADFLPTISIKAKDLAAEMTSLNVQNKDLKGHNPIEKEHVDNSSAVKNMLLQRGIQPENLPAAEDVKKVQRKLDSEAKKVLKDTKKKKK